MVLAQMSSHVDEPMQEDQGQEAALSTGEDLPPHAHLTDGDASSFAA